MKMTNFLIILLKYLLYIIFLLINFKYKTLLKTKIIVTLNTWGMIFFYNKKLNNYFLFTWVSGPTRPATCWPTRALGYVGWGKAGQQAKIVSSPRTFW